VVWSLLLQADSEGPTLIFRVVTSNNHLLSWHTNSWTFALAVLNRYRPSSFECIPERLGSVYHKELIRNGATGIPRFPKRRWFLKLVIEVNIAKSKVMNFAPLLKRVTIPVQLTQRLSLKTCLKRSIVARKKFQKISHKPAVNGAI